MKTIKELQKKGFWIEKTGIESKEFAKLKAKEYQSIGYQSEIAKEQNELFSVMIRENKIKNSLEIWREKMNFVKANNISLPLKKNSKGKMVLDRSLETISQEIAKFKKTLN